MSDRFIALVVALPVAGVLACSPGTSSDPLPELDGAVTRAALEHHVHLLAGEELGGRPAATSSSVRAAKYIADCLGAFGVDPAAGQASHLLELPVARYEHTAVPRLVFTTTAGEEVEAVYGSDFRVVIRGEATSTGVLPIYRGDKKNPLPAEARPDEALFIVASPKDRSWFLHARDQGDGRGWGLDLMTVDQESTGKPVTQPPRPRLITEFPLEVGCERVNVRGGMRDRLLDGEFGSVQLTFAEEKTELVDYNVLGVVPGQDPELSKEVVLLFADYDGPGFTEPKDEGSEPRLRPGADDNASGCAALLELAEALAAGPAPKRTVAFLFTAGDRQQRFGLRTYLKQPALPLERTVAALQVKRMGRPGADKANELWMSGFERTNLGAAFQAERIPVVADTDRFAKNYMRSGAYMLAVEGVVAHSISGSDWSVKAPLEDTPENIDFDHLEVGTVALRNAIRLLADGSLTPAWGEKGPPQKPKAEEEE